MSRQVICPHADCRQLIQFQTSGSGTLQPACNHCGRTLELNEPTDAIKQQLPTTINFNRHSADSKITARLAPDEVFAGTERFEVRRRLGQGGMGIVYAVFDRLWQEEVALKTLLANDTNGLAFLKREFRTLVDFVHPNLIRLYELQVDGPSCFFTMELVEGLDFVNHVRPIGEEANLVRLRDALQQLMIGLDALHRSGIVHRDIKPSNVLIANDGRLVILDFGLAIRPLDSSVPTPYSLVGTISYMAPEILRGKMAVPASDLYAVGVMVYEALTGRRSFAGMNALEIQSKLETDPPPPRAIRPELPEFWNSLCSSLLARDPEKRPSSAHVLDSLGSNGAFLSQGFPRGGHVIPLTGRDKSLQMLAHALARARNGATVLRYVQGESGIGKSALIKQFVQLVSGSETLVLQGRCHEREAIPFKAFDDIADALAVHLGACTSEELATLIPAAFKSLTQTFPALRRVRFEPASQEVNSQLIDSADQRQRMFEAFRELLQRLARCRPLLLVIDDLQWSDADSVALLTHLLYLGDPPPLLFIGCHRREQAPSATLRQLRELSPPAGSPVDLGELAVDPLDATDARKLAASVIGTDLPRNSRLAHRIAEESGGRPYFICELAFEVVNGTIPNGISLDKSVLSRVQALSVEHRRLLELIAVAGQPVPQRVLHRAAEWHGTWQIVLAMLRAARLAKIAGHGAEATIEIFHDRVRKLVVAQLSEQSRVNGHHRLAEALEIVTPWDIESLAQQYEMAGIADKAAPYARQAAERAFNALAFDRAAQFYQAVLRLSQLPPAEERRLWLRLAEALGGAGRGDAAAAAFLRAVDPADQDNSVELRTRAAFHLVASGRYEQGWAAFSELFRELGMELPDNLITARLRTRLTKSFSSFLKWRLPALNAVSAHRRALLCWTAANVGMVRDFSTGLLLYRRFHQEAAQSGDPALIALAQGMTAVQLYVTDVKAHAPAQEMLDKAFQRGSANNYVLGYLTQYRGFCDCWEANWRAADNHYARAEQLWSQSQSADGWYGRVWNWIYRTIVFMLGGQPAEIGKRLWPMLQAAREREDHFVLTTASMHYGIVAWLAADDVAGARTQVRTCLQHWRGRTFALINWLVFLARVCIELYDGPNRNAWQLIRQYRWAIDRLSAASQPVRVISLNHEGQAALAAAGAGSNSTQMLQKAILAANCLHELGFSFGNALGNLLDAGVVLVQGERVKAARLYETAASTFEALDMHLYAAAARMRQGSLIQGAAGREFIERSASWMQQQGIRNPARMTAMLAPGPKNALLHHFHADIFQSRNQH